MMAGRFFCPGIVACELEQIQSAEAQVLHDWLFTSP